jgi:hypothetical protein
VKDLTPAIVAQCETLGATFAAGLAIGTM